MQSLDCACRRSSTRWIKFFIKEWKKKPVKSRSDATQPWPCRPSRQENRAWGLLRTAKVSRRLDFRLWQVKVATEKARNSAQGKQKAQLKGAHLGVCKPRKFRLPKPLAVPRKQGSKSCSSFRLLTRRQISTHLLHASGVPRLPAIACQGGDPIPSVYLAKQSRIYTVANIRHVRLYRRQNVLHSIYTQSPSRSSRSAWAV